MSCANRLQWDPRRGPSISQAVVWKRTRAVSGSPGVSGTRAGAPPGSRGMRKGSPVSSARPGGHSGQPASSLTARGLSPPRVSARQLPAPAAAGLEPGSRSRARSFSTAKAGAAPARRPDPTRSARRGGAWATEAPACPARPREWQECDRRAPAPRSTLHRLPGPLISPG